MSGYCKFRRLVEPRICDNFHIYKPYNSRRGSWTILLVTSTRCVPCQQFLKVLRMNVRALIGIPLFTPLRISSLQHVSNRIVAWFSQGQEAYELCIIQRMPHSKGAFSKWGTVSIYPSTRYLSDPFIFLPPKLVIGLLSLFCSKPHTTNTSVH